MTKFYMVKWRNVQNWICDDDDDDYANDDENYANGERLKYPLVDTQQETPFTFQWFELGLLTIISRGVRNYEVTRRDSRS